MVQPSAVKMLEGWSFDKYLKCIVHHESISSVQADISDIFSASPHELFVVDEFSFPESLDSSWEEYPRKKYFLRSYEKAVFFAQKILQQSDETHRYIIGVRPITLEEYGIFKNVYAHMVIDGFMEETDFITDDEADALPNPDYWVRVR
jgi:hypothetical protein